MTKQRWLWEEWDYAVSLLGIYPLPILTEKLKAQAKKKGWPSRSMRAIETRAQSLGYSVVPIDNYYNLSAFAKLIKISRRTVHYWIKNGLLKTTVVGSNRYIDQQNFREFCSNHPEKVPYLDKEGVEFYLKEKIDSIPFRRVRTVPILDKQTQRFYPSMAAAARQTPFDPRTIRSHPERFIRLEPDALDDWIVKPRVETLSLEFKVVTCSQCGSDDCVKGGQGQTKKKGFYQDHYCRNCKKTFRRYAASNT